jgi:hypothetical protein
MGIINNMNISELKYRFKHHMLADTNIHIVKGCAEHPDVKMPHAHYTHRRWLEWIDNLTWRREQRKLKKLLRGTPGWVAEYKGSDLELKDPDTTPDSLKSAPSRPTNKETTP